MRFPHRDQEEDVAEMGGDDIVKRMTAICLRGRLYAGEAGYGRRRVSPLEQAWWYSATWKNLLQLLCE